MKLKSIFIFKQSITNGLRRATRRGGLTIEILNSPSISSHNFHRNAKSPKPIISFTSRSLHSLPETKLSDSELPNSDNDGPMNEFLSRFVWIMRGKVSEAYPECDKETINGMLLIIVEKVVAELEKGGGLEQMRGDAIDNDPSQDFSVDLWKTVWEVSLLVLDDMNKAKKKVEMKKFLQAEDVKEMCRFAGEVGIRGDMLRELRFKWAREKMEESEFYKSLESLRDEDRAALEKEKEDEADLRGENSEEETLENGSDVDDDKPKSVSLPKRRGKFKYKIYGLDLSDPKWAEVADRVHEAEKLIAPEEPKPIYGKCKVVTERILSLTEQDDPSPLLAEWVELLQPSRVDWIALLDSLKEGNMALYLKIAELVLCKESFQTNIRDYSKLIDAHAKENRMEDAERILAMMTEKGFQPDILTSAILVHMYCKAGNLDRAKESFESLRSQGFQPDMRLYTSMIMAYVNAGQPKLGESLMREMEARDVKPTKEIYIAVLRSFSVRGHVDGAQRISTTMQFAGFQPCLESCTLLIDAYGKAGDPDQARNNFNYMMKMGHKPDDRCTASMIAAYEKKNLLDKALDLLLQLEKDGFEPGVATYTVLVDWFGKLQLVDEAEQLLGRIMEKGEAFPLNVHVSLCDMYSRARTEKKALQALGIVEAKKEQLGKDEFERVINGLIAGGFVQDAQRIHKLMESRGFPASEPLKVSLMASEALHRQRQTRRR